MKQAKSATETAQRMLDTPSKSEPSKPVDKDKQAEEIKQLRMELSEKREELIKVKLDRDAVKKQSESLTKEYDRLMKEHEKLQRQIEVDGRKDR